MNRKHIYISSIIVVVVIVLSLPFEVPYTVYSTGKVYTINEWVLGRSSDGRIVSMLKNNQTGTVNSYGGRDFLRQDAFDFVLDPNLGFRQYIEKGEVIGQLTSNELERLIIKLEGDLKVERGNLMVVSTGEKPETVREAENALTLAKERFAIQEKLLQRTRKLYEDSLIAPQEYDIALNTYEMSRISVSLAQANLEKISTGEKPEEVIFSRHKIAALESQLANLKERMESFNITAPFSGYLQHKKGISASVGMDVIVNILDTSAYVIVTPVQVKDLKYVQTGQPATLHLFNSSGKISGTVSNIDNTIQIVGGKQAVYVTCIIDKTNDEIMPGIFAQTVIECDRLTIRDYLLRIAQNIMYR
ncbi:MAG: HlyD family secretion protein [Cytophagaceae bacterium]